MKRKIFKLETLENRTLLDGALGSEIAEFASQEALEETLVERAVAQHEWMFNNPVNEWQCFEGDFIACPIAFELDGGVPSANFGDAGGGGAEAPTFSDTNTQVVGVDEGDIVETDGDYVYVLSNNTVTIIDVRELAHPRVTSRLQLEDGSHAQEMYLDGDRLTVISSGYRFFDGGGGIVPIDVIGGPAIDFWGGWFPQQNTVDVTVIDVSNRVDPNIINTTEIDGSLANSRSIDGKAYVVVDEYLQFPQPEIVEIQMAAEKGDEFEIKRVYESEESYRARVSETILDVLPNYETTKFNGGVQAEGLVADYTSSYGTDDPNFNSALSVVTVDMSADIPTVHSGNVILTNSGRELFMSRDSMYLFQQEWNQEQSTAILKFDVDVESGEVNPVASGKVPGRMLDQFSADEYNGDLRVATTSNWGEASVNAVYVLDNDDSGDLEIVGKVEELAPTERIFSARFMGDRAFIVTFRQVDPLFAIDMSDPTNPTVEGELKIPGFSNYLQPLDENHLLGIGRDADPVTGRVDALQLSLFDISEMTDPQLVDRYTFEGGTSAWSVAEHDHHAFRYFPEHEKLAIPVSSHERGTWIRDEDGSRDWIPAPYNHALHVFDVDAEEGFDFNGAVSHPSNVLRSVRVGDALYSISSDTFLAHDLTDLENQLGKIHYLPPAQGGVIPKAPNLEDIDQIFEAAKAEEFDRRLDMDGNSEVSPDDATFLVEAVLETRRGDTDLNGEVDFRDFLQLAANFGEEGNWEDGDFNGDGVIDFADFIILSQNYGE